MKNFYQKMLNKKVKWFVIFDQFTTLRSFLKNVLLYQMNPIVFLYNTALSAQLPCLAGLSL